MLEFSQRSAKPNLFVFVFFFGTQPFLMVLFIFFGLAAGVQTMIRTAREVQEKAEARESAEERPHGD